MIDWLLISCIASFVVAIGLGIALLWNRTLDFAEKRMRDDEAAYERQLAIGGASVDQLLRDGVRSDRAMRDYELLHSTSIAEGVQHGRS